MPAQLQNTTTTDKYTDVQLGGDAEYAYGSLTIANNPVSILYAHGIRGQVTEDEYAFVTPTTLPLVGGGDSDRIVGLKIKSAKAGVPAQVSGWLVEPGRAGIQPGAAYTSQISAGGSITPGLSSLQIQKDGVLVGTEPILDFADGIVSGALGGFLWRLTDDGAGTRVVAQLLGPPVVDVVAGNALPAAPVDGQTVTVIPDKTNNPGVRWLVQWNAATGWWDVLGSSPLRKAGNAGGTLLNGFTALGGTGTFYISPSQIVLPFQGDYDLDIRINATFSAGSNVYDVLASDVTAVTQQIGDMQISQGTVDATHTDDNITHLTKYANPAANHSVAIGLAAPVSNATGFGWWSIEARPVRIK